MLCPSCGKVVPGEFAFCPFCGAALGSAASTPGREERKTISVVFVDLVGFTSRAERLDPEDVRALLTPYHLHVRAELERFGGTVEKFIGDAVMAVFGAPVTHEDDAERAVRAALAVRDWAGQQGEELRVRVAVATGEALVSLDAQPSRGESMVAGDVVNTAARLQSAAPLNGILLGEHTFRATAHAIESRPVEPVIAKGKAAPVLAWEAIAARSSLGIDLPARSSGPLVGRARPFALLESSLTRVREERSPQLVTVLGVPGIGKTRLVHELFGLVEQDSALIRWRQGRSLPYGEGVTFWALAEIVKAQAGILEGDSAPRAREKMGAEVARVARDSAEAAWLERHLLTLAGLADDGRATAEEGPAAWRRYLELLAEERPLVLVFEDLHWADDPLLDFVDQLVERTSGVPLLVLGTARPELHERRPGWGGGKANALAISLAPLTDDETAGMVGMLLERSGLDRSSQGRVIERAGGNPLYAEQYVRVLLERGDVAELPESVQGIIAARLDALSAEEKELLQDASVVGKVFWLGALEAVGGVRRWQAEELLHSLERKEFVQRSRSSSVASEGEYAFRHVLVRDIAYGQMPRGARSVRHQRVAGWIESLGRPEDQAELLAHHYLQAIELGEAAGLDVVALGEPARLALRDAGDRAAALNALETAVRFYDAALRLWPADEPGRSALLYRRAAPVGSGWGADPKPLTLALEAFLAEGDTGSAAVVETLLSSSFWMQGRADLAAEHRSKALALVADAAPSRATARVLSSQAMALSLLGESQRALELATQAVELCESLGWDEGLAIALNALGVTRADLGDWRGIDDLVRAAEAAERAGRLGPLGRSHNNLAVAYQMLGDLEAGYSARLHGATVVTPLNIPEEDRWFQGVLADHLYRRGDWDESMAKSLSFIGWVDAGVPHYSTWQVLAVQAEIELARGDVEAALRDAERGLAMARVTNDWQSQSFTLIGCAHIRCVTGDHAGAEVLVREVLESMGRGLGLQFAVINLPTLAATARVLGVLPALVHALDGQTQTVWIDAVRAYSRADYRAAADLLRQIGARTDEAEARLRAAEVLGAAGDGVAARAEATVALEFYLSVGATRYVEEARAVLASLG